MAGLLGATLKEMHLGFFVYMRAALAASVGKTTKRTRVRISTILLVSVEMQKLWVAVSPTQVFVLCVGFFCG